MNGLLRFLRLYGHFTYWRTSGLTHWGRNRFTPVGGVAGVTVMAAGMTGLDTTRSMAHYLFCFGVALFVMAWATTVPKRGGFTIRRRLPRLVTDSVPFTYSVTLTNETGAPFSGGWIAEEMADPRPSRESFMEGFQRPVTWRDPFERLFGFRRWQALLDRATPLRPERTLLPPLAPGESCIVHVTATPRHRGAIRFTGAFVETVDLFGLMRRRRRIEGVATLVSLPRRYPTPPWRSPGIRRYHQGGMALAGHVGDAEEFVGLRDYRPGDPLRNIHWKSWARTGTPVVKEYEEEYFSRHALALDNGVADGEERFEEAVRVAASFVVAMERKETILDLLFVAGKAWRLSSGRGQGDDRGLLTALAAVAPGGEGSFATLARTVESAVGEIGGLILVLVAWDDQRQASVKKLRAAGTDIRVVVIDGKDSLEPGPMIDIPHRFHHFTPEGAREGLARL